MTLHSDVGEKVDEMFRRTLQAPSIDLDRPLVEYGLDSVRSTELVVELEVAFRVEISDEEAAQLMTARAVIDHVVAKIERTQRSS